jgi:putative ubiquitin-RnfH superfamily antitoxin RatB of RatAB toxin-antitoxin module
MSISREAALIGIEVAYALPQRQCVVALTVTEGCTVIEAIEQSGLREEFPEMEVDPNALGIFGRKVRAGQALREGDRVEIYRPLIADPKEARRQRAEKSQKG